MVEVVRGSLVDLLVVVGAVSARPVVVVTGHGLLLAVGVLALPLVLV